MTETEVEVPAKEPAPKKRAAKKPVAKPSTKKRSAKKSVKKSVAKKPRAQKRVLQRIVPKAKRQLFPGLHDNLAKMFTDNPDRAFTIRAAHEEFFPEATSGNVGYHIRTLESQRIVRQSKRGEYILASTSHRAKKEESRLPAIARAVKPVLQHIDPPSEIVLRHLDSVLLRMPPDAFAEFYVSVVRKLCQS